MKSSGSTKRASKAVVKRAGRNGAPKSPKSPKSPKRNPSRVALDGKRPANLTEIAFLKHNRARLNEVVGFNIVPMPAPENILELGQQIIIALIKENRPLTMAGLALGFGSSAETYRRYELGEMGEEYIEPMRVLRTFVLADKNEKLLTGEYATSGAQFDLKNMHGWSDKADVNVAVRAKISSEPLTDDDWAAQYGSVVLTQ